jgi:prephenate dehydratase
MIGNSSDVDLDSVKRVYSHPQVFEQCKDFLKLHPQWDLIACTDTATAVLRVKENDDSQEAAIAGKEALELYGMALIRENIESSPRNFTRFVLISAGEFLGRDKNKTSLIFSVSDRPGSLHEVLKIFADHDINMVKLESRPIHGKPWEYMFYTDLEINIHRPEYSTVLEQLKNSTEFLKILGTYSKGSC